MGGFRQSQYCHQNSRAPQLNQPLDILVVTIRQEWKGEKVRSKFKFYIQTLKMNFHDNNISRKKYWSALPLLIKMDDGSTGNREGRSLWMAETWKIQSYPSPSSPGPIWPKQKLWAHNFLCFRTSLSKWYSSLIIFLTMFEPPLRSTLCNVS